jgi:hypothetical protein
VNAARWLFRTWAIGGLIRGPCLFESAIACQPIRVTVADLLIKKLVGCYEFAHGIVEAFASGIGAAIRPGLNFVGPTLSIAEGGQSLRQNLATFLRGGIGRGGDSASAQADSVVDSLSKKFRRRFERDSEN